MKTLNVLTLAFAFSLLAAQGLIACSSDGDNNGTAGSSAGGSGASGGSTGDPWKKGKAGNVSSVKVISQNGGPVLGLDIGQAAKTASKPMDFKTTYKTMDVGDDAGLPPTIPVADFSEAAPTDVMVLEIPPYMSGYPPYTAYYHPDATVDVVNHFPNWQTDFALDCFNGYMVTVNGLQLLAYSGVVFDVASGNQRQFLATNSSDCIYELTPQGQTKKLVCGLLAPTAILYDPQQFLLVTTSPGYTKNMPGSLPVVPVELWKVTIGAEPEKTKIAEMPIGADYAKSDNDLGTCYVFPFTDYALPNTIRIPVTKATDGGYLVADMGAGKIYKVSQDGTSVTEFKGLEGLQIAAFTQAPNEVVYMVTAPLLGDKYDGNDMKVIKGVTLWALDPQAMEWTELQEFTGYENLANNMSGSAKAIPCPTQFQNLGYVQCLQPDGVNLKIVPGQTVDKAYLMVSDTITFRLFQIIMNLGGEDADAGTGGSSGTGGASGEGGAAGEAGSSGTGGDTGTGGASGEGGASGDGGSSGEGGATGDGGSSGTAGEGGSSGTGGDPDAG